MKKEKLKILILEDNPYDAELNIAQLKKENLSFECRISSDEKSFTRELISFDPDLILSDYNLPKFNGLDALKLCKKEKPLTPFIIVTGSLDEETAADCIKKGAWDYVLKEHLVRLNPAVNFALQYKEEIRARKEIELKILENEDISRKLLDNIETGVFLTDINGNIIHSNKKAETLTSVKMDKIRNRYLFSVLQLKEENSDSGKIKKTDYFQEVGETGQAIHDIQFKFHDPVSKQIKYFSACLTPVFDNNKKFNQVVFCFHDNTEKIQMENSLKLSEDKYRSVFNSVNDAIFLYDVKNFKLLDVNDKAAELFEYSREELMNLKIGDFSVREDGYTSEKAKKYALLALEGNPQVAEWKGKSKSGRIFWIHTLLKLICIGNESFLMAIFRDIDDFRKAEVSLEESQEHYRALVQNSTDTIMRFDKSYRHIFVNEAVRFQLNIEPSEFLNKTHREMGIFSEEQCEFWETQIQKVFDTKKPHEVEFALAEGENEIYLEWRLFPEFNINGDINTVLTVARDITDKKLVSRKLRASEEMLKLVLDNIPQAIFWKDRSLRFIGCNKAFVKASDLNSADDILGKTEFDLSWNKKVAEVYTAWDKKVMKENKSQRHIIDSHITKRGTLVWNDTTKVPLHDENGSVIGVLGTSENITKIRAAQEALKHNEERIKMALEATSDGIWDWNLEFGSVYFSARYFTMLGYNPDEFKHDIEEFYRLLHPEDEQRVRNYFENSIKNKTEYLDMELRLKRKDGSYAWIRSKGKLFTEDNKNNPVRIVGTHEDISLRKRQETIQKVLFQIAESVNTTTNLDDLFENIRNYLHSVVDTTNCYIALYDKKTNILSLPFLRDEKDEFFEFPAGKTLTGYVVKTRKSQLLNLQEIRKLEASDEIELIGTPSVSWLGVPLSIGENIIGVFVVQSYEENIHYTTEDMTLLEFVSDQIAMAIERKRDQDYIRQNQERQRRIIESSPDGLVVIDIEGRILDFNTGFPDLVRIHPGELPGTNFFDFIADKDIIKAQNILNDTLKTSFQKNVEFRMKREQGHEFYAETSLGLIDDNDKNDKSFVIVIKNIDERKAYEYNLRIAKERAEEADRLKTAFLSNMSHEIRTPMNAIVGFAELLLIKENSQNEKKEFIQQINNGADSLMRLIDDIIDISKIEAGQIRINNTQFDLMPLLKNVGILFKKNILRQGKKDLQLIEDNKTDETAIHLVCDEFRLNQILTNLLSNAIKFTERGEVRYGIKRITDSYITLYVKDKGLGISQENISVIFERFRQGHDTKTKVYGGTGLGLAISKHLVEVMGGEIYVESEPGKGSEFYFTLPYIKTEIVPKPNEEVVDFTPKDWSSKTFLVVEDEESNFKLMKEILRCTKARIIWAKDGIEAIDLFKKHPEINLILLDVQMPKKNGYEVAREIRSMHEKIPIIVQTAYAMAGETEQSLNAGCNEYISKPIKINELMYVLNKYLT
jgi:two-component system sensor histidine kinase/response regulator